MGTVGGCCRSCCGREESMDFSTVASDSGGGDADDETRSRKEEKAELSEKEGRDGARVIKSIKKVTNEIPLKSCKRSSWVPPGRFFQCIVVGSEDRPFERSRSGDSSSSFALRFMI